MKKEKIGLGSRKIGEGEACYVIAEIGINHNGSIDLAKRLIDASIDAGADAVKFQKRTIPTVYTPEELCKPREVPADIIEKALERGVLPQENVQRLRASRLTETTNGDLKWALEFSAKEYAEIDSYCKTKKIVWFGSPWDEESAEFLSQFNPPAYKIASASLTDERLLRFVRSKGKPVILSTGMSTTEEVDTAVEILGKEDLLLMHCVSTYPAELREINLSLIQTLRSRYEVLVGYSGHERGVYTSLCAVVLGAVAVERHITLDRSLWGSDQAASLEPKGLALLTQEIRNFEQARGDGVKIVLESEKPIQ
ncbi:MAG: N-acetylneuraminate synthase family protein, partial [Candidatus Peribacteraceae bacterium]|nr:N-acetylneuraminate synthase family protein [Candidatus Peribacteraceae bacterium]